MAKPSTSRVNANMLGPLFNSALRMSCLALLSCAALCACGARDARFNPSHFRISRAAAPPEIVLPDHVEPGESLYGITTNPPETETLCCAAQSRVLAPVRKEGPASQLRIGLFVPPGTVQHLQVTFPNGAVARRDVEKPGVALVSVPVPPALRTRRGTITIRLDASHAPYVLVSLYFV